METTFRAWLMTGVLGLVGVGGTTAHAQGFGPVGPNPYAGSGYGGYPGASPYGYGGGYGGYASGYGGGSFGPSYGLGSSSSYNSYSSTTSYNVNSAPYAPLPPAPVVGYGGFVAPRPVVGIGISVGGGYGYGGGYGGGYGSYGGWGGCRPGCGHPHHNHHHHRGW